MTKRDEPSGPNPTLTAKTGIRLTLPELGSVLAVVAFAVLGWARLDGRLTRIEERMSAAEGRERVASQPILIDPSHP